MGKIKTNIYQEIGKGIKNIALELTKVPELYCLLTDMSEDPFQDLDKFDLEEISIDLTKGPIRTIPRVDTTDLSKGVVVIIPKYGTTSGNPDFSLVGIYCDVFVPLNKWQVNLPSQRPYEIMGYICHALNGKRVTGIGTLVHEGFEFKDVDDENSLHTMEFTVNAIG